MQDNKIINMKNLDTLIDNLKYDIIKLNIDNSLINNKFEEFKDNLKKEFENIYLKVNNDYDEKFKLFRNECFQKIKEINYNTNENSIKKKEIILKERFSNFSFKNPLINDDEKVSNNIINENSKLSFDENQCFFNQQKLYLEIKENLKSDKKEFIEDRNDLEDLYLNKIINVLEENKNYKKLIMKYNEQIMSYTENYKKIESIFKVFSNIYNEILKVNNLVSKNDINKIKKKIKFSKEDISNDEEYSYRNLLNSLESLNYKNKGISISPNLGRKTLPQNFNEIISKTKQRKSLIENNFGYKTDINRDLYYKNHKEENFTNKKIELNCNSLNFENEEINYVKYNENKNEYENDYENEMNEEEKNENNELEEESYLENGLLDKIKELNTKTNEKIKFLKNYILDFDKILLNLLNIFEDFLNNLFNFNNITDPKKYLEEFVDKIYYSLNIKNIKAFQIFYDKFFEIYKKIIIKIKKLNIINNFDLIKSILNEIFKGNSIPETIKSNIQKRFDKFNKINIDDKEKDINYFLEKIYNFINKNSVIKFDEKQEKLKYHEYKEEIDKLKNNAEIKKLINNYEKTNNLLYNTIKNDSVIEQSNLKNIENNLINEILKYYNIFKKEVENQYNDINFNDKIIFGNNINKNENYYKNILKLNYYEQNYKIKLFILTYHSVLKLNNHLNNKTLWKKNENNFNRIKIILNNIKKIFYEYFNKIPQINFIEILDKQNDNVFNDIEKSYNNLIKSIKENLNKNNENEITTQRSAISLMEKNTQKVNPIPILIDVHLLFNNFKLLIFKEEENNL